MKTDKLTNLLGLYLLAALLAAVALIFFVIRPIYGRAAAARAEVKQTQSKIAALEQLEKDTEDLRRSYEDVKAERDEILAQLPVSSEEERLLALLSELAGQSGVVLSTFAPDQSALLAAREASEATGLNIYPASINASGSYRALATFLEKLEQGARFVDIESGVFSAGQSSGVTVRVDLKAYYQGEGDDESR